MATVGNIFTAKVKIKGSRPLFWHKFGPDALPLEKQEKTGVAGNNPQEWRRTILVNREGQFYIEPTYIFGAMCNAAKYHKVGRKSAVGPLTATLQVTDDRVLIDRFWPGFPNGYKFDAETVKPPPQDPEESIYMDIRGVRNPATHARNIRYRICASPGWACEFTLLFDRTIIDRNMLHSILIDAGRLVGIGNGRAIGMGRFEVESFEIQE